MNNPQHDSKQTKIKNLIISGALIIAFSGVFYIGFASGQSQTAEASKIAGISDSLNATKDAPGNVDFSLFWKAWNIVNEKFVQTHHASTTTDKDRIYGAIQGMVAAENDPYTVFFPPAEATNFESEIEGSFEGVGMEMGIKNGALTVITPLKGSPAEKAGIRIGDKVVGIDGKDTSGFPIDQAVKLIRGKKGTSVTLMIARAGLPNPIEIKVVRDTIDVPTLDTKVDQKNGIFTIKLNSFSSQSATLFRNALRDFVNSKQNRLILDLRGNPGGFLDAAVDMASWFLPPGKTVVTEDYGAGKDPVIERSKGYNIFNDQLKMVILIDGGSASASEILSGALSEYGKAKLVGTKSFGKGSVQEYIKLNDETALKVTVARWLTPNGKSISEEGLTPDVEVKMTADDVTAGRDPQMDKAIELLK
jgi:carboxyl-terminal processing protease